MYLNTPGIIISKKDTTGPDKLLNIYTLELGKVRAVANGARKTAARLTMATEPLVETEFMFYNRNRDAARMKVIGGKLLNLFPVLRADVNRYTAACQVAETVDRLTFEHAKNDRKYALLKRTLELMEDSRNPQRLYSAFVLRFLKLCGYGLDTDRCVSCSGQGLKYRFSIGKKGLLCGKCSASDPSSLEMDGKILDCFRSLGRLSGEDVDGLVIPAYAEKAVRDFCDMYLMEYTNRRLRTKEFARDMRIET